VTPSFRRRALVRALLGAWLLPSTARAQDPRANAVALAARDWLALVDRGEGMAAHTRAGAKFRESLPLERWMGALAEQRTPRGRFVQRTLVRTTFQKQLPGAPEGDYAVLLFRSSFEKQVDAAESVTLEREKDGAWRVVGYFIR